MVKILLAPMHVSVCPLKLDSSVQAAVCESQASAEFIQVNPANAESSDGSRGAGGGLLGFPLSSLC